MIFFFFYCKNLPGHSMVPRQNRWTSRSWKDRRRYVNPAGPIWACVRQNWFSGAWILIWLLFWPIEHVMWSVKGTESHKWTIAVTMSRGWARRNMIFTFNKGDKIQVWERNSEIERKSTRLSKRAGEHETKQESGRDEARKREDQAAERERAGVTDLWTDGPTDGE